MPTSNGQITSRDIRQEAIKTLHIVDNAVATAKIPDQAVTFPDKIDDPIWSTTFGTFSAANETITTTRTIFISETVDVPAWVDQLSVFVAGTLQLTNTSGGDVLMQVASFVDGAGGGGVNHEAVNNQTQTTTDFTVVNVAGVAGSSILVELEASVSTGTNTDNRMYIYGIAVGTR